MGKGLFKQRAFRRLWLAQTVSMFGDFLALFGVTSLITFRLHGTAVDVASVTVAYMLPLTFIAPIAGVLVDRLPVKKVMIASDVLRAFIAGSLLLAHDVPSIALVMAGLGFVSSFFGPAQTVALRSLVAPEDLMAANAMVAQSFYVMRILSPAIAGALVTALTERACFWIDAASFVFSAAMVGSLAIVRAASAVAKDKSLKGLAQDFLEGNRFIFTHKTLAFGFLASAAAMFMLSSFSPLISLYVRDTLHAKSLLYGIVSSMVGVGLIAGTTVINKVAKGRPIQLVISAGLLGLGLGAALLGAFQLTATAALSTFAIGVGISMVVVPAQTLSQKETPPAMMGRVSSTFLSLFSLAQVLGLMISGTLAARLGVRPLFIASGGALALLALAGSLIFRNQRSQATPRAV